MRNSIRWRTFCYFAFSMLVVIMAFSMLFFRYFYLVFEERMQTDQLYTTSGTAESVGNLLANVRQNAYYLCSNETLASALVNKSENTAMVQREQVRYAFSMNTGTPTAPLMKSAFAALLIDPQFPVSGSLKGEFTIQGVSRQSVYSALDVKEEEWYQETMKRKGQIYAFRDEEKTDKVFFAHLLRSTRIADPRYNENAGVVLYAIAPSTIYHILENAKITDGTIVMLTFGDDLFMGTEKMPFAGNDEKMQELLSMPNTRKITRVKLNETSYTASSMAFQGEWRCIVLVPSSDVLQYIWPSLPLLLIVILLFLAASALISMLLSRRLVRPIIKLSDAMGQVHGTLDLPPPVQEPSSHDEIAVLYESYNSMLEWIQKLLKQAVEEAEKLRSSELKAMQAQINPHFIYNTLDSVSCSALLEGNDDIVTMVTSLIGILKYSVNFSRTIVPLGEEIDYLHHYIRIQELRYKNGFRFICDVPEIYFPVGVSQIVLQPLVENALFHANCQEGTLEIRLYCDEVQGGEKLRIHVVDNGCGGDAQALNRMLLSTQEADSHGIGIRNVNKRIRLLLGEDSGLHYEQLENRGLDAVIEVPLRYI